MDSIQDRIKAITESTPLSNDIAKHLIMPYLLHKCEFPIPWTHPRATLFLNEHMFDFRPDTSTKYYKMCGGCLTRILMTEPKTIWDSQYD